MNVLGHRRRNTILGAAMRFSRLAGVDGWWHSVPVKAAAMFWMIGLVPALLAGAPGATGKSGPTRLYIANDDHTDYLWSGDESAYRAAFIRMLDYYMARAEATADRGRKNQAKFNADGSLWFWEYERTKSRAEFERLMNHFRDGAILAPMTPLILTYGSQGVESVLRGLYYAGRLERRYGVRFVLAQPMENQTMPLGVASLWAGAGARYCWHGVCACASPVKGLERRPHELYWWRGLDGSRVLTKWYRFSGDNKSLGGYAEMRQPDLAALRTKAAQHGGIAGGFGWGWDDLESQTTWFEAQAQAQEDVYLSNEVDFFEDVERSLGATLPEYGAAFGNDWDLLSASMVEVTARVKRSVERLRAAEALATLVSLKKPGFMTGRSEARDQAFMDLGLYFEHDLTADGPIPRLDRLEWQRRKMQSIENYSQTLLAEAVAALGGMIPRAGANPRFFVFNPLSWTRTDVADFPCPGSQPVHAVDLTSGQEVASLRVTLRGQSYLRILAPSVAPVGYKVFEIRAGSGSMDGGVSADADGGTLSNEHYVLAVNRAGAIISLRDKRQGGLEFATQVAGRWINDFGSGDGPITVENAGAVSATLRVEAGGSPTHTTRVTLYRGLDRIDIANEITQNFGDTRHWSFAFNLAEPDVWHEEVGAVIRAKPLAAGGHYAPGPDCVRHDYQTLNHFADMSGAGRAGVTLSSADCAFMRLGDSLLSSLDTHTPCVSVLAGGQVSSGTLGIPRQGGESRFLQRFALRTHRGYDAAAAMRFALEHQNPLVTGAVTGGAGYPETQHSLLTLSDGDVLLWALKPAEEGIEQGVILRVWNLASTPRPLRVNAAPGIKSAKRTTHIETDLGAATVTAGSLRDTIAGHALRSYRLVLSDRDSGKRAAP
jgi:alpha-mannosidase